MLRKLQFLYKKRKTLDLFGKKIGNFDHFWWKIVMGELGFLEKIFKNFGQKYRGNQGNILVFKKISKIILIPLFFRAENLTGAKIFVEKHLFLTWKRSEIFDFRRKFWWNLWVNAKTSAAGEIFLKNAYLYAENDQKMTNFWFKKCQICGFFVQKWKNWTILVKNGGRERKNQSRRRKGFEKCCF